MGSSKSNEHLLSSRGYNETDEFRFDLGFQSCNGVNSRAEFKVRVGHQVKSTYKRLGGGCTQAKFRQNAIASRLLDLKNYCQLAAQFLSNISIISQSCD